MKGTADRQSLESSRPLQSRQAAHRLFEAQAARRPDAAAVVVEGNVWSFGELNRRSNQMARRLRAMGVGSESIVAILSERGLEAALGMLAALKAGAAFLPLDPSYPPERLAFMLRDSRAAGMLAQRKLSARLPKRPPWVLDLDAGPTTAAGLETTDLGLPTHPESAAYLIYTSGSTGRPKGVVVPQRAMANHSRAASRCYGLEPGDRVLQAASISFDLAVEEMFPPWAVGAAAVILPGGLSLGLEEFAGFVRRHQLSVLSLPTPFWHEWAQAPQRPGLEVSKSVRLVVVGTDQALAERLADWQHRTGSRVGWINAYGPSEATVTATAYRHSPRQALERVPIGRPIDNMRAYVLDRRLRPVRGGGIGQLHIGGLGVARGYLGRPGRTAAAFLPDPFSGQSGARLYASGDLARQLKSGDIEFLGRADNQVKVRGYRIELEEIEAVLKSHPAVREAALLARETAPGEASLTACLVAEAAEAAELADFLGQRLPGYMVPSQFAFLDRLPRTPGGKLDRQALRPLAEKAGRPDREGLADEPLSPSESALAGIWSALLGIGPVGRRDHFFALGGHSLLAARLLLRIRDVFGVSLQLEEILSAPRLADMARVIESAPAALPAWDAPPQPTGPRRGPIPLSFAQQRLWLFEKTYPGLPVYNISETLRLQGDLDAAALKQALAGVVERHEVLRTRFAEDGRQTFQAVGPAGAVELPLADLSGLTDRLRRERAAAALGEAEARCALDPPSGKVLRACLLRLSPRQHLLLITIHHAAADGWSMEVFYAELAALYQAWAASKASPLEEMPLQYADFAVWQRQQLSGRALEAQTAYWKARLEGLPALELPADRPRPPLPSFRGARHSVALGQQLRDVLAKLSRRQGSTLFMTLLAAFQALLARYSRQTDIAVGTPAANRPSSWLEGLIGFFVNMLVLRADLSKDPAFAEHLQQVREAVLEAHAHQDLPFERLVEALPLQRDPGRHPLFQAVFQLLDYTRPFPEMAGLRADLSERGSGSAKFDLELTLKDTGTGLSGYLEYASDLFDSTTMLRLLAGYRSLLEEVAAHPERRLSEFSAMTGAQRHQVLAEWNDTAPPDEGRLPVQQLFEGQAARRLHAVALQAGEAQLSYGRLDRRADQLAGGLRALVVGAETRVGILMERSLGVAVAILAVLKADGAYVPLDPEFPARRLAFMVTDSRTPVVLTRGRTGGLAAAMPAQVQVVDLDEMHLPDGPGVAPSAPTGSGDRLAYVMYTSGSTGQPKGVAVPHRAVTRLVRRPNYVRLSAGEVFLQFAPHSFDAATLEVWGSLANGARLVTAPPGRLSLHELGELICRCQVTTLWLTAALFQEMAQQPLQPLRGVGQLLAGGDVLPPAAVEAVLEGLPSTRLINGYGPTENTTFTCCHNVAAGSRLRPSVPIGRPVTASRAYVLDDAPAPLPIGVVGQLCAGGEGLARGYLFSPRLTAERFLPDPVSGVPGARLYATGDLARCLPGGEMEFWGRRDQQVKLRGFRIELGEVEAALESHPSVETALVMLRQDRPGVVRLAAYLKLADAAEAPAPSELRQFLSRTLPGYMLPAAYVVLDSLPHTPSGKFDRRALPAPKQLEGEGAYQAPRTPLEEILADAWAEALGRSRVGVFDDFFELGGHSLVATQIVSRIRDSLGFELPIGTLFQHPSVAALALAVETARRGKRPREAPRLLPLPRGGRRLPPSFAQHRIWFVEKAFPTLGVYHIPIAFRLRGPLQAAALERSLQEIVRRHEALRTRLIDDAQGLRQEVAPVGDPTLPLVDLSGLRTPGGEAERISDQQTRQPFNLARGPHLRPLLLRLGRAEHVLLATFHHAAADAWSLGIFNRELSALYARLTDPDQAPRLPDLPVQYADFALWQREWLSGPVLEEELAYWRERLAGAPASLEMPADRPRPALASFRAAALPQTLPASLAERLREFSRQSGATLFMTLLAGYEALLHRWSGQDDLVVGVPIAGRNRSRTEGLMGVFINMLALRCGFSGDPTAQELLSQVRQTVLEAYDHQELPFEKLVTEIAPRRDPSRSPVFQVLFQLVNTPGPPLQLPDLEVTPLKRENRSTELDIELTLTEAPDGALQVFAAYNPDLFDASTIGRLLGFYRRLLEAMLRDPHQKVSAIPLLSPAQSHQMLLEWNDTRRPAVARGLLHEIFAAQAARLPDAPALTVGEVTLSYAELDDRAERLGGRLCSAGVGAEDRVGVLMGRTAGMATAVLAVLKAGGAYLPLDPAYPQQRLAYMLQDAGAEGVLSRQGLHERLQGFSGWAICLDGPQEHPPAQACRPMALSPDSLAYVIYTSGSSGRPKGVAIAHRSACQMAEWAAGFFSRQELSHVLAATSICFDLSVFELFAAWASGGRVVLLRDALQLPEAGAAEMATLVNTVPSALSELLRSQKLPPSVRTVNLAGEALPRRLAEDIYAGGLTGRLMNLYGPSEDTTYSTFAAVPRKVPSRPSIGRPLANTQAYLLDAQLRPLPTGAVGELCLAGAGLARGYLGRPAKTASAFVPDPFSRRPGGRLYRTGDRARLLASGELDFLGRFDHQVKLRGFRIELGEVESALLSRPEVAEAAAVVQEDGLGGGRLTAYVSLRGGGGEGGEEGNNRRGRGGGTQRGAEKTSYRLASTHAAVQSLRSRLPDYMVPSSIVVLEAMPRTPNGKVDRKALPAPPEEAGEKLFAAPSTPTEEILAVAWQEVLEIGRVGRSDNFFDLGGHSLLATRVMSRIRDAFGVELALTALFTHPTLSELAQAVEAARRESLGLEAPPPAPLPRDGRHELPVSFAQQRAWIVEQSFNDLAVYHIPVGYRIRGTLNIAALERSLKEIVRRHESLHSRLVQQGTSLQLEVDSPEGFALPTVDLSALAQAEEVMQRFSFEETRWPFDLACGPHLRAFLVRLTEAEHALLITFHHVAVDGWSLGVLSRELSALYASYEKGGQSPLADLPVQYPDFAFWQRQWLQGRVLESHLGYWKEQLDGAPAWLDLPADRPRPSEQSFRGAPLQLFLPASLAEQLRELSLHQGVTLFMTLLAGFAALLHRICNQTDIVVGSPVANRNRSEIEGLIGFFANMLVMRCDLSGDPSVSGLLAQVRETALGAYIHQDLPFEKLVEEIKPERDLSRNPVFQVFFQLFNTSRPALRLPGLEAAPLERDNHITEFDLEVSLMTPEDGSDGLELVAAYSLDIFDATTVMRMLRDYRRLLEEMARRPEERVSRLAFLSGAEKRQILAEWNDTCRPSAGRALLHEGLAAQASQRPDASALTDGRVDLSYGELERRAGLLAARLLGRGLQAEMRVGLLLGRSAEMAVSMLAVLKAGGAYLPLDPAYPEARLAYMLEDSASVGLLTRQSLPAALQGPTGRWVLRPDLPAQEPAAPCKSCTHFPENLAYVIYTSGSTGRPKGVAITHRSAAELVHWAEGFFSAQELSRVMAATSICFDLSVFELFATWGCGGTVVLTADALELPSAGAAQRVTLVNTVPSALSELVRRQSLPDSVQTVNLAGEALPGSLAEAIYAGGKVRRLVNLYGPSEDTTYSTWAVIPPDRTQRPPIGRPLPNSQAYVLDWNLRPVPIGVSGELCLGGAGLARGYLGRPGKTASLFVPDPFGDQAGGRLYRTGDRARFAAEGQLDFLGRFDHQVKLRGFRIELGEVEAALRRHSSLAEAVAAVRRGGTGEPLLAAYLVTAPGAAEPGVPQLRDFLGRSLPAYMLPSAYLFLDELPLTPNRKVDRKALPAPADERSLAGERVAPRNLVEQRLSRIWEDVLGLRDIGVRDDFFDLGGHSLLALHIVTGIRDEFGVDLPLGTLFRTPTIEKLAGLVECDAQAPASPLVLLGGRQSDELPFFCVHGVGGNIFRLVPVARASRRPFYGIQGWANLQDLSFLRSSQAMAARYLEEIRRVQPQGPYCLGGLCLGCLVAYEMACRLEEEGRQVAFLGLLDTPAQRDIQPGSGQEGAFMMGVANELGIPLPPERLKGLEPARQMALVVEEGHRSGALPPGFTASDAQRYIEIFNVTFQAFQSYQPRPYGGRLHLFTTLRDEVDEDPTWGWGDLAAGGVEVHPMNCQGAQLFRSPNLEEFTAELLGALDQDCGSFAQRRGQR